MQIIDLSPPIHAGSVIWPGDVIFELQEKWSQRTGAAVNVATVRSTTHIGAHIDSPNHVIAHGETVEHTPLDACMGACVVVDVSAEVDRNALPHGAVPAHIIRERIESVAGGVPVKRVLLRHYAAAQQEWDSHMPGLDPGFFPWFANQGGVLVGVDLASFDQECSTSLDAHHAAIRHGVVMLEGLNLHDAPAGVAELIALPLALHGADASPVRAVLRVNSHI